MDSVEVKVLRRQTVHFINEQPEQVTMHRGGTRTSDGAGGYSVVPGDPIDPQTFRLIIQNNQGLSSRNVDGEEISPAYVMIGQWDANIRKGDVFTKSGRNYEVMFVRDHDNANAYETWAEVVYRG